MAVGKSTAVTKCRDCCILLAAFLTAVMGCLLPVCADAPAGLWQMNAFNGQVAPGAVGATLYFAWGDLNPAQNLYTWGSLEAQIEMHAQAGRPVSLLVTVSRSGWYGGELYVDDSPAWVGATRRVPMAGKTIRLPAYDDSRWQVALQVFIGALGRRYNGDPRIDHVNVSLGLDGESQAYQSAYETYVVAALGSGYRATFERYALASLDWYHAAFGKTPLYAACNPGGQGLRRALIRRMVTLGIGYGNHGLQIDEPTAWGPTTYETSSGNYGLWAPMRDLRGRVPLWLESTSGTCTPESVYWGLLLGLTWHPTGIDLHREWFAANPDAIAWANGYLNAPDHGVWIAFRDAEYGSYTPGSAVTSAYYLSGWPSDLSYGMARMSAASRVLRASLPLACREQIESRQARQFTGGLTLAVEKPAALGAAVKVRVCYLDTNEPLQIILSGEKRQFGGQATTRFLWAEWQQALRPDWDGIVQFEGGGTLHMVEITRVIGGEAPAPTETWTLVPTVTPTVTATCTPTPVVTPCPAALSLTYAERMSIRATAGERLMTLEERLDWENDPTLLHAKGLGAPLSEAFEAQGYTCRAFALGIVVVDGRCDTWATVEWQP